MNFLESSFNDYVCSPILQAALSDKRNFFDYFHLSPLKVRSPELYPACVKSSCYLFKLF